MVKKKTAIILAIAALIASFSCHADVFAYSGVLKNGSTGSDVASLQKDLAKLGYLSVDPTGYYGDLTEAAIRKVQKDYGYMADGIAGEETLSLIDRLRGRSGTSSGNPGYMKEGDENSGVAELQKKLIRLGYLHTKATGYYGPATKAAVERLQEKYGYKVDGIAGSSTLKLVDKLVNEKEAALPNKSAPANNVVAAGSQEKSGASGGAKSSSPAVASTTGAAESVSSGGNETGSRARKDKKKEDYLLKWFGNVEKIFGRGETATVYDIATGKSFRIKRTYGTNHADCETLTKKDTAVMKQIYGGAWSWQRRAVIVMADGVKIAACMTGYPHAGVDKYAANKTVSSRSGGYGRGTNLDAVKGNSMNGVFDIHFLGSKNHYNNKIDPKHQALIKEAAEWAAEKDF